MKLLLKVFMAIPLLAADNCPTMLTCEIHNASVFQTRTEYHNAKRFGVYVHKYYDKGKQADCIIYVKCDK